MNIFAYVRNAWFQFKNVVWPSRSQTIALSILVLVLVACFAGFFIVVDRLVALGIELLFGF